MRNQFLTAVVTSAALMFSQQLAAQPNNKSPGQASTKSSSSQAEAEVEAKVNIVWQGFLATIRRGDVAAAQAYVHPRSPFAAQLKQSFPQMQKRLADVRNEIALSALYGPIAECDMIVQRSDGSNQFYPVSFVKEGQAWLIKSM
ncbi:hypothetical protein [Piscinibacter gummiphilus]|uniref:DUF4878 domain-containing protein n=1 Tax=Piscinibacter gummiphilus TaxID=946333 RepID=A0ABZ0CPI5_9BURK|nr:hypothetical protein [Piscinibacter gummiphilus]WOB06889.1 hypothetical protein RXV79_18425 [Piscinibacter gummiphilus]